jgi:glutamate-1-semialdehyde 2,1-aminomutase
VPPEAVQHTLVLEFNNIPQLEECFALHGKDIACLMVEAIAGNMNFIRSSAAFAKRCRELCTEHGALLAYDEVMTGFRVGLGGAQQVLGIVPDMTVLGKVIGGGMPLAAFGASRAVMEQLAPLGAVYQAGTLSGNPIATACGLATLKEIQKPGFYESLSARTQALSDGLRDAAHAAGVPWSADCQGGMFGFLLLPELPQNYGAVMKSNSAMFNKFFHGMLDRGVYFAPALYEAGFVSAAHTALDVERTVAAAKQVFASM